MKYRRLTAQELTELEKDFVRFLATQSITAEDWESKKVSHPGQVEEYIEIFSDMIFERVLDTVNYLEWKMPQDLRTFFFDQDKIYLQGILLEGNSGFSFTEDLPSEEMVAKMKASGARLKIYRADKPYAKERNLEIFGLMEQGALISKNGEMYHLLTNLF